MKKTAFALWTCLLSLNIWAQPISPGSALQFNGANSYVSIATTGSLTGTFTVELWANPNHPTNALSLMGSRGPSEYSFDFKFWQGNLIHGDIGNGSSWSTTAADAHYPYSTGTWSHLAYVVTPTSYTIYANGFQVAASSYAAANPILYDANHQLVIGDFKAGGSEFMNGQIDEVRIWKTARNASQIQTNSHRFLTGSESGLMGYWRFDEGSGSTTADASGHGFTGTLVNAAWVASTLPIGSPAAPCINFDDVTDGTIIDTQYVSAGVTFTNPIGGHIYARSGLGMAFSQANVVSVITGDTNSPNYSIFPFFYAYYGAVDAHFAAPARSVSIDVMPVGPLEFLGSLQARPFLEGFDANGNYLGGVYYSGPLPINGGFSTGPKQTLTFVSPSNTNNIAIARFSSQQNLGPTVYGFFDNLRWDRLSPPAPLLGGARKLANGSFQFSFTSTPGATFTVLAAGDASLPLSSWTVLGAVTEISPGQFQFTDSQAVSNVRRFYRLRSP